MSPTHEIVNGIRVDFTQAQIDAIEAEWKANLPSLPEYKQSAIAINQVEAGSRIAALFGTTYGTNELNDRRFNNLMLYNELTEKETTETITELEIRKLEALRIKKDNIKAIRNAENTAAALIRAVVSIGDLIADKISVDSIHVIWP